MEILDNNRVAIIKVIASRKNWIETEAVNQLEATAKLEGIKLAVGLPDLHPGKIAPIGAAFLSRQYIYPHLVGGDIGCGMGFWQTGLESSKIKLDKWGRKLNDLDGKCDTTNISFDHYGISHTCFDDSLGTIGGGNHFAELQKIESVCDEATFYSYNLDKKRLFLLAHSGSRGLGESILFHHTENFGYRGLVDDTAEAKSYIESHNHAMKWAVFNRSLIAHRFLSSLNTEGNLVLDICHNSVTQEEIDGKKYWLHRKGATPSAEKLVIIPGSRGDFSYLVQPLGSHIDSAFSLAHGAGRKWQRSAAKARLVKFRKEDLTRTALGGIVICEAKDLIYEEAPQAYKKIGIVVQDLVDEGLIKVIAILRPLITYKTRKN